MTINSVCTRAGSPRRHCSGKTQMPGDAGSDLAPIWPRSGSASVVAAAAIWGNDFRRGAHALIWRTSLGGVSQAAPTPSGARRRALGTVEMKPSTLMPLPLPSQIKWVCQRKHSRLTHTHTHTPHDSRPNAKYVHRNNRIYPDSDIVCDSLGVMSRLCVCFLPPSDHTRTLPLDTIIYLSYTVS